VTVDPWPLRALVGHRGRRARPPFPGPGACVGRESLL